MNNPDLKYDINPFVCFGEHNRSGLLESEDDISTGLFMCYFIKLKEFTTKPHRKANSPYFKVFTTETEIKVNRVVKGGGGGAPNHESLADFPSNHESRTFFRVFHESRIKLVSLNKLWFN